MAAITMLDKYIRIDSKVYQLFSTELGKEAFVYNGRVMWYEPDMDGQVFSYEEAEKRWPELLV